ncbi:MAG TPA: GTPase Era [Gammaproteobacteria bacterium]|nr:GTPase Era [Gammaproteobacteria bacterium]
MVESTFRAGFIVVAGRPNVGKSTLMNALVGRKVSIVTPKPQTTRRRILGVKTLPDAQLIFVDTPGLHSGEKRAINRSMNRAAVSAASEADLCLLVVEAMNWGEDDQLALQRLSALERPLGLVVNKLDKARPRERMLPFLQEMQAHHDFRFIVPVSAHTAENLAELMRLMTECLPESPMLFPADQITDQDDSLRASEFVREQLIIALREEVPYSVAVQVDECIMDGTMLRVTATIWVEREGQKAIVIGQGGTLLKQVGKAARLEMEREFGHKVFLRMWVKVRENWADDERALATLGFEG